MEQLRELLPKLIVSIGLLYFVVNPWFRHQNTMNRVDAFFLFSVLITLYVYAEEQGYIEPAIVLGVLGLLFVGAKIFFQQKKRDGYVLFNVFKNDFPSVEAFFKEKATDLGISVHDIHYCQKKPFLVVMDLKKRPEIKKLMKEVEKFIREKIKIHFWVGYVLSLVGLIILAIIWRF
jgi:hypothetical protein